jgi:hypothetical protein
MQIIKMKGKAHDNQQAWNRAAQRRFAQAVGIAIGVICKWIGSLPFDGLARRMTWMRT